MRGGEQGSKERWKGTEQGREQREKRRSEPHRGLLKFERTETLLYVEGTGYF